MSEEDEKNLVERDYEGEMRIKVEEITKKITEMETKINTRLDTLEKEIEKIQLISYIFLYSKHECLKYIDSLKNDIYRYHIEVKKESEHDSTYISAIKSIEARLKFLEETRKESCDLWLRKFRDPFYK